MRFAYLRISKKREENTREREREERRSICLHVRDRHILNLASQLKPRKTSLDRS